MSLADALITTRRVAVKPKPYTLRMTLRVFVLTLAVATVAATGPVNAQSKALFTFHSNPWLNLHHFLRAAARGAPVTAALSADERATWNATVEFYKPYAPGVVPPALGRAREEMEFEGPIEQGLGFSFRSRLAVKTMAPLRFPRYLGRDPRDFFYLTLKPVLPGPAATVDGEPVEFSSAGLPNAGWPPAFCSSCPAPSSCSV